jgi:1,6-anhydro-N-acetylmuramate kinase
MSVDSDAMTESTGPIVDPTENVKALSEASAKRQDDLRHAQNELIQEKIAHLRDILDQGRLHAREIRDIETKRLDAIRQVDVLNQSIAAARAETAIQTLAATTLASAEALRTTVATTERTLAAQAARDAAAVNERLSALERNLSSGAGGAEALARARESSMKFVGIVLAAAGIVITLIFKFV